MRLRAFAVALGLGALAATPCLALTVQAAPPRPDVAQHLHSTAPPASGVLPAPSQLQGSFVATGRPQLGSGFTGSPSGRTTSFSAGPLHATTSVTPGYGARNDLRRRDDENPLALTPPRR